MITGRINQVIFRLQVLADTARLRRRGYPWVPRDARPAVPPDLFIVAELVSPGTPFRRLAQSLQTRRSGVRYATPDTSPLFCRGRTFVLSYT